jgi:hypothetical protein
MAILILKKSGKNFGEGDGRGARGGETPRGRRREEGPRRCGYIIFETALMTDYCVVDVEGRFLRLDG